MNLLIVTQAVDQTDPVLGFFHRWIEEFSKHYEQVTVICLRKGKYVLPNNVQVVSLGKEERRTSKWHYAWRFLQLIRTHRAIYDSVFVHMNPEYVVLGGLFWRLWCKRIVFWYTHRKITMQLRLAVFLANSVATAAPESLRIHSAKVQVIGHGIDVETFLTLRDGTFHDPIAFISVGRITPIKRLELVLNALSLLHKKNIPVHLTLVGMSIVSGDQLYKKQLQIQIEMLGLQHLVSFHGAVSYDEMPKLYAQHDISLNAAPTGGIDKAVLESMASGTLVVTTNQAFASIFGTAAPQCITPPTASSLAAHLETLIALPISERITLSTYMQTMVRQYASVERVVNRLVILL